MTMTEWRINKVREVAKESTARMEDLVNAIKHRSGFYKYEEVIMAYYPVKEIPFIPIIYKRKVTI